MAIPVAELFARVGFRFDDKDLKRFEMRLTRLKAKLTNLRNSAKVNVQVNTGGSLKNTNRQLQIMREHVRRLKQQTRSGINVRASARTSMGGGRGGRVAGFGAGFAGGMAGQLGQFVPGAGLAGAAYFGGRALLRAGQSMEQIQATMLAVAGTTEGAQKQFVWLQQTAEELGLSFEDSARGYTNFIAASKAVGFETKEAQKVFKATAEAGRALGLSNDNMNGTLRAITQMMSKGNIQAEELRGQLGERLPGAVGLMAKSMKVTVPELNKMLERGEVIAQEVMPAFAEELAKFARSGGALDKAINSNVANMQRFRTAMFFLKTQLANGGFMRATSNLFKDIAISIRDNQSLWNGLGRVLAVIAAILGSVINVVLWTAGAIADLVAWMWELGGVGQFVVVVLGLWAAALFVATFPITALIIAIGVLLLILDDIISFFQGKESVIGDFMYNWFTRWFESFDWAKAGVKQFFADIGQVISDFWNNSWAGKTWNMIMKASAGFAMPTPGSMNQKATESANTASSMGTGGRSGRSRGGDTKTVNINQHNTIEAKGSPEEMAEALQNELGKAAAETTGEAG